MFLSVDLGTSYWMGYSARMLSSEAGPMAMMLVQYTCIIVYHMTANLMKQHY